MEEFKLIPIPAEDYDALGITPNSVLETCVTDSNALIVRVVKNEDMVDLVCGNDCECCPMEYSAGSQSERSHKNGVP